MYRDHQRKVTQSLMSVNYSGFRSRLLANLINYLIISIIYIAFLAPRRGISTPKSFKGLLGS